MYRVFNIRRKLCKDHGESFSMMVQEDNHTSESKYFVGSNAKEDMVSHILELILIGDDYECPSIVNSFLKKNPGLNIQDGKMVKKPRAEFGTR